MSCLKGGLKARDLPSEAAGIGSTEERQLRIICRSPAPVKVGIPTEPLHGHRRNLSCAIERFGGCLLRDAKLRDAVFGVAEKVPVLVLPCPRRSQGGLVLPTRVQIVRNCEHKSPLYMAVAGTARVIQLVRPPRLLRSD